MARLPFRVRSGRGRSAFAPKIAVVAFPAGPNSLLATNSRLGPAFVRPRRRGPHLAVPPRPPAALRALNARPRRRASSVIWRRARRPDVPPAPAVLRKACSCVLVELCRRPGVGRTPGGPGARRRAPRTVRTAESRDRDGARPRTEDERDSRTRWVPSAGTFYTYLGEPRRADGSR